MSTVRVSTLVALAVLFKVPAVEQNELISIVGGTKPDIVAAGR